jgi:hypothetical protein
MPNVGAIGLDPEPLVSFRLSSSFVSSSQVRLGLSCLVYSALHLTDRTAQLSFWLWQTQCVNSVPEF